MTGAAAPIGLRAVHLALGDEVVDNVAHGGTLGLAPDFVRDKIGFLERRVAPAVAFDGSPHAPDAPPGPTTRLAQAAIEGLVAEQDIDPATIDCLIVCTQNPDGGGLPNTASALHGRLGLSLRCAAFDLSLGCSGYVYGLSVVSAFMSANGFRRGVLITSDPYSKIVAADDRASSALFGDGATASLLEPGAPWRIGAARFGSDGSLREAISLRADGTLAMNGRQVFAFSAKTVPPLVNEMLDAVGIGLEDVDLVLAHQGSRYIVEEIRKRLGADERQVPFRAERTANLVSSSIPAMLAGEIGRGEGRRLLLLGFGVGLSWGGIFLEHRTAVT